MLKRNLVGIGALAALVATPSFGTSLRAQAPQMSPETVQLAFGYDCDDRFRIRNDGGQAVDVEYTVQGAASRSKLHLNSKESAEMSSVSNNPVELWVNGKLVATERKGNRPCASSQQVTVQQQASPQVVVRPIETNGDMVYTDQGTAASVAPVVVVAPAPYYGYPYYYDPYFYGGFRSSFSVVVPFYGFSRGYPGRGFGRGPIFVGGRGRPRGR